MTNRMSEALKLFKDIANYNAFVTKGTPVILFLNKKDLFKKKITEVPLNVCFRNYTGPNEYNKACGCIFTVAKQREHSFSNVYAERKRWKTSVRAALRVSQMKCLRLSYQKGIFEAGASKFEGDSRLQDVCDGHE